MLFFHLQSCEVARQFLDNRLEGTGVGLGIANEAKVKQESIPAVLFIFNAHRTPDQLFPHCSAKKKKERKKWKNTIHMQTLTQTSRKKKTWIVIDRKEVLNDIHCY